MISKSKKPKPPLDFSPHAYSPIVHWSLEQKEGVSKIKKLYEFKEDYDLLSKLSHTVNMMPLYKDTLRQTARPSDQKKFLIELKETLEQLMHVQKHLIDLFHNAGMVGHLVINEINDYHLRTAEENISFFRENPSTMEPEEVSQILEKFEASKKQNVGLELWNFLDNQLISDSKSVYGNYSSTRLHPFINACNRLIEKLSANRDTGGVKKGSEPKAIIWLLRAVFEEGTDQEVKAHWDVEKEKYVGAFYNFSRRVFAILSLFKSGPPELLAVAEACKKATPKSIGKYCREVLQEYNSQKDSLA